MSIDPSKRKIIIDTDPGQDDAIAILFALAASDRLDLHAITTVAGNVPLEFSSRNARIVLDWAQRPEIPVYAGCPRPLLRELITAVHIHGVTGLEGVPLHEPSTVLAKAHAVDFLVSTLRQAPDRSMTLCSIGPLTNVAAALIQAPDVKRGIKEIIIREPRCCPCELTRCGFCVSEASRFAHRQENRRDAYLFYLFARQGRCHVPTANSTRCKLSAL
jgi:inosine-uridine preferring nucleoside hydrolase